MQENKARHNYYTVNDSKSSHFSNNKRATPNGFNCHSKYRLSGNIFNNVNPYHPVSLKNTEYWNLIPGASTTFPLASATKSMPHQALSHHKEVHGHPYRLLL